MMQNPILSTFRKEKKKKIVTQTNIRNIYITFDISRNNNTRTFLSGAPVTMATLFTSRQITRSDTRPRDPTWWTLGEEEGSGKERRYANFPRGLALALSREVSVNILNLEMSLLANSFRRREEEGATFRVNI